MGKHEHAIERLKGVVKEYKGSIKRFPRYYLVPVWEKNLKDVERAIKVLKVDQEK